MRYALCYLLNLKLLPNILAKFFPENINLLINLSPSSFVLVFLFVSLFITIKKFKINHHKIYD